MDSDEIYLDKIKNNFNSQSYCKLLGIKVINLKDGFAHLSLPHNPNLLNQEEVIHGGIITSLADSAAAASLLSIVGLEEKISSIELKINFLHAVKSIDLFADAKIIHKGSRTAVVEVDISTKEKTLVAKFLSSFIIM
jgi:acyl-CoA thioesterase